tara:strand:+ start:1110 stop:1979 length:870 start_codon:yes stop_codon:yes gene_type:complete
MNHQKVFKIAKFISIPFIISILGGCFSGSEKMVVGKKKIDPNCNIKKYQFFMRDFPNQHSNIKQDHFYCVKGKTVYIDYRSSEKYNVRNYKVEKMVNGASETIKLGSIYKDRELLYDTVLMKIDIEKDKFTGFDRLVQYKCDPIRYKSKQCASEPTKKILGYSIKLLPVSYKFDNYSSSNSRELAKKNEIKGQVLKEQDLELANLYNESIDNMRNKDYRKCIDKLNKILNYKRSNLKSEAYSNRSLCKIGIADYSGSINDLNEFLLIEKIELTQILHPILYLLFSLVVT